MAITISDYLGRNGIDVVLTGGACVSIYTDNKYMSYDLDFVLISDDHKKVKELLTQIGFYSEDRYFKHKNTEYFLDFISPPLSVGSEPVKEIAEITKKNKKLRLLSPTDCVKDRLAAYYHWNDRQSLEQAIMVCRGKNVDLKEVERWSLKEGMRDKYTKFMKLIPERG
ncbi:MAG: hypothetical protein ABIN18_20015 [Pseudomonadota bacterium]